MTYLNGEDITTFGATTGAPQTKTFVKINDKDAFDAAVAALVSLVGNMLLQIYQYIFNYYLFNVTHRVIYLR